MGIKLDYASVYHPQTNGQVERANGLIMSGIKPRLVRSLTESNTQWVEELDSILWGLRTTPNRTTGFTPFFMVYGAEAVLPCDIIHDSPRVRMYEEREAELDRQDSLDALEEERDVAKARSAFYQQQARRYQSREVRAKNYNIGELVLRLPDKKKDKLKPKWEGPFIIDQVLTGGAYCLRNASNNRLEPNPWNAARLRRFYAKRRTQSSSPSSVHLSCFFSLSLFALLFPPSSSTKLLRANLRFVRTHSMCYSHSLYLGASLTEAYLYGLHAQYMCHTSACTF